MASLQHTIKNLKDLLGRITHDLGKAEGGNKAASQRVRTNTVKLEKVAKSYRKESIAEERTRKSKPKKAAAKHPKAKAAKVKAKPKAKAAVAKPRALAFKRPTAKLPLSRFK